MRMSAGQSGPSFAPVVPPVLLHHQRGGKWRGLVSAVGQRRSAAKVRRKPTGPIPVPGLWPPFAQVDRPGWRAMTIGHVLPQPRVAGVDPYQAG